LKKKDREQDGETKDHAHAQKNPHEQHDHSPVTRQHQQKNVEAT